MTDIYKWLFGARGRAGVTLPVEPLPEELLAHRAAIEATVRPIIAGGVHDGPPAELTGSQLGGWPWWPVCETYPTDVEGKPLYLLAQINFAETETVAPFPARGLLQVFIAAGSLYGANLDDPTAPHGCRVVLHENLAQPSRRVELPLPAATEYLPLEDPFRARAITLSRDAMPVDMADYRFDKLLPAIASDEELAEMYADWHTAPAVRLGGYPSFTQEDPRTNKPDLGDFRRVAYNWDCC